MIVKTLPTFKGLLPPFRHPRLRSLADAKMIASGQVPLRDAREDSGNEGREEIGAESRSGEAEEEENGESPSHLPFAPSSEVIIIKSQQPSAY